MKTFYKLNPLTRVLVLSFLVLITVTAGFVWNLKEIMNQVTNGEFFTYSVLENKMLEDVDPSIKSYSYASLLLESYSISLSPTTKQIKEKTVDEARVRRINKILEKFESFDERSMHNFLLNHSVKIVPVYRKTREACQAVLQNLVSQKLISKEYNSESSVKLVLAHLYLLEAPSIMLIDKMISSLVQAKLSSTLVFLLRKKLLSDSEVKNIYGLILRFQSKNQTYQGAMREEVRIMFRAFSFIATNYPWTSALLETVYGNPINSYLDLYRKSDAFTKSTEIHSPENITKVHPFLRLAIPNGKNAKHKIDKSYFRLLGLMEELQMVLDLDKRDVLNKELGLRITFDRNNYAHVYVKETEKSFTNLPMTKEELSKKIGY